jgi:hypothetical protein
VGGGDVGVFSTLNPHELPSRLLRRARRRAARREAAPARAGLSSLAREARSPSPPSPFRPYQPLPSRPAAPRPAPACPRCAFLRDCACSVWPLAAATIATAAAGRRCQIRRWGEWAVPRRARRAPLRVARQCAFACMRVVGVLGWCRWVMHLAAAAAAVPFEFGRRPATSMRARLVRLPTPRIAGAFPTLARPEPRACTHVMRTIGRQPSAGLNRRA